MKPQIFSWIASFLWLVAPAVGLAQQARFHVLAFYSATTEPDHVQFADGALKFFAAIAARDNFALDATTNWDDMNLATLSKYQVVMWLNDFPSTEPQRLAFQNYVKGGGAWLGFHVSAFNDRDTHWPWLVDFLGGGLFDINSWPPLPAKLTVDDRTHPVTRNLPATFVSPSNEWYIWKPSPRLNKDVRVLVSLDPSNYPLGLKNVLTGGDLPVVWTNTKYKMIYMNMGHGDKIFDSPTQNQLFEDAITWLGTQAESTRPSTGTGLEISPRGVVVNPRSSKVYAVNHDRGAVTVIDSSRNTITTVKVGDAPEAIAVNPDTNRIYVGNTGSGTVSVIDGNTDTVVATVKVGDLPYAVAVNPATNKVYVSRTFSSDMTVIDGATNTPATLKAGVQADAIGVNPATNKLYLISYESNDVSVIDGTRDTFSKVAVGTHLWGIAVNSATNKIYFTNTGSSSVAILEGSTNAVTSVNTGEIPSAIAIDEVANQVYVTNYAGDSVTLIDGASNRVIATVKVGSRPQALAVNPKTHRIFVANTHSNNVTVIDGMSNSAIAAVSVGIGPYAIAVDATSNKVFVPDIAGDRLTVIDGSTLASAPAGAR